MIDKFQKEYSRYWKDGSKLSNVDTRLRKVYAKRKERIDRGEIKMVETVKGNDFLEETVGDMTIYTGREEVCKKYERFQHTLFEKKETVQSRYVVRNGKVESYVRADNFDGTLGRYLWVAGQAAIVIGAIAAIVLPDSADTIPNRILDLIVAVLIAAIPVAAIAYLKFKSVKSKHAKREADEEKRAAKARREFEKEGLPFVYEEIMGVIDTLVKMVHYAEEESELKNIDIKDPKKLLRRYDGIIDCSIAEAEFGSYEKDGKVETFPAAVTVYALRSNGKTLTAERERVRVMLERKGVDWKLSEYHKLY